ncbi:MAG: GGDEF domain-containing protein [Anaerolineae bacterium]|nr:GGDEF domain-containing protein [Anaerolineae bacterium]
MKSSDGTPHDKNVLPTLIRRFGIIQVVLATTFISVLISVGITSVIMYVIDGSIGGSGIWISVIVPLCIAPIASYASFTLVHRLDLAEKRLRQLSNTDELTGVLNRRYFFEQASREFERGKRHQTQFSVAILDFDNFKDINDIYGHLAGDAILRHIAQLCMAGLRHVDVFARYGGDEFIFLLPDTNAQQAKECLDRILEQVRSSVFQFGGHSISARVSIGVSVFRANMTDFNALMREADFALYAAKHQGGMRVIAHRTLTEV